MKKVTKAFSLDFYKSLKVRSNVPVDLVNSPIAKALNTELETVLKEIDDWAESLKKGTKVSVSKNRPTQSPMRLSVELQYDNPTAPVEEFGTYLVATFEHE